MCMTPSGSEAITCCCSTKYVSMSHRTEALSNDITADTGGRVPLQFSAWFNLPPYLDSAVVLANLEEEVNKKKKKRERSFIVLSSGPAAITIQ